MDVDITATEVGITLDELRLAARNHAFPLELLREPITPAGLHYLLIHFDIPPVDVATWRLELFGRVELPLADAVREEILLAYEMNGAPLLPQHGYPLRVIVPGWYGMTHVKWLRSITVVGEPFRGWQQEVSYRLRQVEEEQGEPVNRILPRSLLVPPGIPEFADRSRYLDAGPCLLQGRAWSGRGAIVRVEVSGDGGV